MAIFFQSPSKEFLPISFKIQLWETSPHKQKEQRQKDLKRIWRMYQRGETAHLATLNLKIYKLIIFLKRLQRLEQEWQKSPAGPQANRRQKPGLVWRNRKKISQIIKDYFYLPFFLLFILCVSPTLHFILFERLSLWGKVSLSGMTIWREGRRKVLCPGQMQAGDFLHFAFFSLCSFIPVLVYFNPFPSPILLYRAVFPKKGRLALQRRNTFTPRNWPERVRLVLLVQKDMQLKSQSHDNL